jgi:Mg2+-importing ATPase
LLGKVVSIARDGVNETLVLKKADVDIATDTSTDVAKLVVDIILANDSLTTI